MDGTAEQAPPDAEPFVATITLIRRPDRRQIATRRNLFRGGRRADDFAEQVPAAEKVRNRTRTDGSVQARGSAIVMGWKPRPGTLRRAAGSY